MKIRLWPLLLAIIISTPTKAQDANHNLEVGKNLDTAKNSWEDAKKKLISGQQSITQAAREMEKLGAKPSPNKQLPEVTEF